MSRSKPHRKTPSSPPGPPQVGNFPFWVPVAGRKTRRGDHRGKGMNNWLPKTG